MKLCWRELEVNAYLSLKELHGLFFYVKRQQNLIVVILLGAMYQAYVLGLRGSMKIRPAAEWIKKGTGRCCDGD
jgi:hypothetical protein